MKKSIYIFLLVIISGTVQAQQNNQKEQKKLYFGYGININYNFYCHYQNRSKTNQSVSTSGQVLNILPGLGLSLWCGDIEHWILSVEGGVDYSPFALNVNKYAGMGALSLPITAKLHFPFAKQKSLWAMLHIGIGAQFNRTELYNRAGNNPSQNNSFFTTIVGEMGIHVAAVGYWRRQMRDIEYFIRVGGFENSISINTGIRLTFWNSTGK